MQFIENKLPVKQQLNVKLLICYTQRDREIGGFGVLTCSLQMFLRVNYVFRLINDIF